MPIYEYTCSTCNEDFELLVRGNERQQCPECGTTRIERKLSVPAAHVTGGASSLPVCSPAPRTPCGMGGCGLPECG